jgi:hypothetical protein
VRLAGQEETKNLAGKVLRLIQDQLSDAEFGKNLAGASSTIRRRCASPLPIPETQSAFHQFAQRNSFRHLVVAPELLLLGDSRRRSAAHMSMQSAMHVYEVLLPNCIGNIIYSRRGKVFLEAPARLCNSTAQRQTQRRSNQRCNRIPKFRSRSADAVIRVYDATGNLIQTYDLAGEFQRVLEEVRAAIPESKQEDSHPF